MKFSEKIQAIELRKEGLSYTEIKKAIPVSKSTLSDWLKDIELTDSQEGRLNKLQAAAYIGAKKIQAKSNAHHCQIREDAKKEAASLINNPLFVAGLMLYWAEGDKRSERIQFSNSDPEMVKLMMKWFREFCKVTSLPLAQFNKPYIKPTIFSNRKNKLYEGTCMIRACDKDLWTRILGWIDGIKNLLTNV